MGQLEPVPSPLARPPLLSGRYVVSRLIGKGAQARVYLAFDTRLKHWRAVKVLAPSYLEDDHVRARFEQEAQAMARLSHPNLLRVVDVEHDGRTPYMVMELARGGAVTEWMKRHGPVPSILACRITQACCAGLAHAHLQSVVHRDVKPHNILIREDGSFALTDFGIAQVMEREDNLTATGTVMGTFAFMAPEQRTDAKSVDLRADVYSLGASLYTMLTGRTSAELFFAESRDAILSGIPETLRTVILTACKYEREQRYASMFEFHDALERRIQKLHPDPHGTNIVSQLLAVPDRPPEWVDASAEVEELRLALIPTEEPPMPREVEPTQPTLDDPEFDRAPPERDRYHRKGPEPKLRPRSSTDDLPDYVDPSTVRERPFKHVEIDETGARSLHAAEPIQRSRWTYAALSSASFAGLVLALVISGLLGKLYASHELSKASEALIRTAHEERQVIADLVVAGADEAALQDRFFRFDEASADRQAEAAAEFVELVAAQAEETGAQGLALSHVSQLSRARRDWVAAKMLQTAVRSSFVGRITGDLGIW